MTQQLFPWQSVLGALPEPKLSIFILMISLVVSNPTAALTVFSTFMLVRGPLLEGSQLYEFKKPI